MSAFVHTAVLTIGVTAGLLALSARPAPAAAPVAFPLKSTSIALPNSDRAFPDAPGLEAVNNNCTACHSPGMILTQPPLSKAAWDAEVHKMITVYKAPVADADVAAIVTYLVEIKGAK